MSQGRAGRGRRAAGVGQAVGLLAFLPLASRAPIYARLMFALLADERMPASRKALLAGALGYIVVGKDVIPDRVPLLGGLDDLVVVVLAVDLFFEGVPRELLIEKLDELGIDKAAFLEDVARIRRLTPRPVRATIRRIPELAGQVGEAAEQLGIGRRLRSWIS